eukprot:UN24483
MRSYFLFRMITKLCSSNVSSQNIFEKVDPTPSGLTASM